MLSVLSGKNISHRLLLINGVTKLKILIITQWFDPEPTLKGLTFAEELLSLGHSVEVITGFPNYPGGTIYPGFNLKLYQKENLGGVIVHRVPLYPSHNNSALKRVFNYASFAFSSLIAGLLLSS